ncbi:amino acid ABC transporter permease [Cohnella rhizosphaerae]|uniref:Amino acid ABC transporter permease n=1 Tax=Cohnella rhizosphaerae TaxID=1457232 RepID=A0A9X4QW52_9BACL|nr:amino acid ABC transporter permease [Cohnella rhizosphaerae]MDG0813284.1 amino acid ABC transporter permease [Cohnella rhizosphaerae]
MGTSVDVSYVFEYFVRLLPSVGITLKIVVLSLLIGSAVGMLVALPRLYRIPVLQRLSQVYVSFFRGTPLLIQLFLIYYGLPELLKLAAVDVSRTPVLVFVVTAYALHSGAFISEAIRAAVGAVDRGQVEAGYAVGMTGFQAFRRVVLPQAISVGMPVFGNLVIANLKDTSLAFSLGIMELTGKAQTLPTMSQRFFESYLALALLYFILSFVLEKLLYRLERRLLRHEAPNGAAASGMRRRRVKGSDAAGRLNLAEEGALR